MDESINESMLVFDGMDESINQWKKWMDGRSDVTHRIELRIGYLWEPQMSGPPHMGPSHDRLPRGVHRSVRFGRLRSTLHLAAPAPAAQPRLNPSRRSAAVEPRLCGRSRQRRTADRFHPRRLWAHHHQMMMMMMMIRPMDAAPVITAAAPAAANHRSIRSAITAVEPMIPANRRWIA